MTPRQVVPLICILFALCSSTATAQVVGQEQAELARKLGADRMERGMVVARVRHMGPDAVSPELRVALIAALEQEGELSARRLRGEIGEYENMELIGGLAQLVAAFRDPRAIDALAGAMGESPPARDALAEFGERAVPAVLRVLEATTVGSVGAGALNCLRFMVQGVGGQPLTDVTRERIRQITKERLTTRQKSFRTVWGGIDLAVALEDPELRRIVQSLASDRDAVRALGVRDTDIEDTQRRAIERLAGVPARPWHASVEEWAKRWK
jgi:hypothetical protein